MRRHKLSQFAGMQSIWFSLATCLAFGTGTYAVASGGVPRYRTGIVWEDSKSKVVMQISIRLDDFAPGKLVRLAELLKDRYRDHEYIGILIFSSHYAAVHCNPVPYGDGSRTREGDRSQSCLEQLHANYSYDAKKSEEHLDIIPGRGAVDGGTWATRIDLPLVGTPQCRLQINGRCLIALSDFLYPSDALKTKASATITLTGTITQRGSMDDVRIVEAVTNPRDERGLFVKEALHNLRTWRFEGAPRRDGVRITYRYAIDASLAPGGKNVQFALPDEVVISGNSEP